MKEYSKRVARYIRQYARAAHLDEGTIGPAVLEALAPIIQHFRERA